jgi:choline/ethanolamine kinase
MRVYGEIAQRNDYMLRNSVIFALFSEKKKGPKLYGMYPEGRIEEYIPVSILFFYIMYIVFHLL